MVGGSLVSGPEDRYCRVNATVGDRNCGGLLLKGDGNRVKVSGNRHRPAISIIMFFYHIIAFAVIEKHW